MPRSARRPRSPRRSPRPTGRGLGRVAQPLPVRRRGDRDRRPKKMNPSARRAARSNAASPDPPSQIGIGPAGSARARLRLDPVEAAGEARRPARRTNGGATRSALPPCARVRKSCPRASYSTSAPADPYTEASADRRRAGRHRRPAGPRARSGDCGSDHGSAWRNRFAPVMAARWANITNGSWNGRAPCRDL